jgi:hypothetical protein
MNDTPWTEERIARELRHAPFSWHEARKYRQQELPTLFGLPAYAEAQKAAQEDTAAGKDSGTCVLGAGVCINVIPQHARKPRRFVVLHAPFQGNVGSAAALKRAQFILQEAGIDCYWYDGVTD